MMSTRRVRKVAAGLVASVAVLAGCQPDQLEIYPIVYGTATFTAASGGGSDVTLSGTIRCSRDNVNGDPEPVDVFIRINGIGASDGFIPACTTGETAWSVTESTSYRPTSGQTASVEITFCTNPGELVDEDCVTVHRPFVRFVAA